MVFKYMSMLMYQLFSPTMGVFSWYFLYIFPVLLRLDFPESINYKKQDLFDYQNSSTFSEFIIFNYSNKTVFT